MKLESAPNIEEAPKPERRKIPPEYARDAELVIKRLEGIYRRINEEEFRGIHPDSEIDNDKKVADTLEREFARRDEAAGAEGFLYAQEAHKLATAMEVMIAQPLGWWGDGKTVRTSRHDDFTNGVDMVLELPGNEHIGFAVDFSTSSFQEILRRKIDRATKHVTNPHTPAEVKYYRSPVSGKKERITVIPVVIGLDAKDAKFLVGVMASVIRLQQEARQHPELKPQLKKKLEELKKHPAQMVFLLEIDSQLQRYQRLLESSKDPETETMKERLRVVSGFIRSLAEKKVKDGIWMDQLGEDGVLKAIQEISLT